MAFKPNETLIKGFNRIANASKSKVKQYLLKRAGLATHDIRLFPAAKYPLQYNLPSAPEKFYYYKLFTRGAWNTRISIVNASGTDPVVVEIHFFLEIPKDIPIDVRYSIENEGEWQEIREQQYSLCQNHLQTENPEVKEFDLPVLKKGKVLVLEENTFSFGLDYRLESTIRDQLGNDPKYTPPEDLLQRSNDAYKMLLRKSSFWYGLVLDNEELLPYQWNHKDQRFVPGFFSDGSVVN